MKGMHTMSPNSKVICEYRCLLAAALWFGILLAAAPVAAVGYWNGRQIMDEVYRRHQRYPYVYEEQAMVMIDSMGQRNTRQAKRYSRSEKDGTMRLLYIFETPPEVKGVTLMATRNTQGQTSVLIYLPALGPEFLVNTGSGSNSIFPGTDFSIEDLAPEDLDHYIYERADDTKLQDASYFVIDVYPADSSPGTRQRIKRHYVRKDNFYITLTDNYDRLGMLYKKQSSYDLKQIDDEMWRADIILNVNIKNKHRSLIKVNRRVFSEDYVPAAMFSKEWILANYPPVTELAARQEADQNGQQDDAGISPKTGRDSGQGLP